MNLHLTMTSTYRAPHHLRSNVSWTEHLRVIFLLSVCFIIIPCAQSSAAPTNQDLESPVAPGATNTTPPSDPRPPTSSSPTQEVARSGEVVWTLRDVEVYLKRYRAWLHWETSAPQPISVLEDLSSLRRVLINAIEREVIVRQAQERELSDGPIIGRAQLRDWLLRLVPSTIRPKVDGLTHFIRGRLKMRADDDLEFFWHAVEDAYWVNRQKEYIVALLPEADAQAEWKRRGELMTVWLMQVPRVPTSSEISKGIKAYPREMKAYYEANPKLFSQPLRLLVEPFWIRGGKLEAERLQAVEARDRLSRGDHLEQIIEEMPMLTQGGIKSLRGKSIPPKTETKEGAITPVRLTRYGWTFYRIKRIYPAYVRSLAERSVQREVAAAVLRERDDLPRARKLAQSAAQELARGQSIKDLKAWGRSRRVRVNSPAPFFASTQNVVPSIGLAPELHQAIVNAPEGATLAPIKVRQHYVIARIISRTQRDEAWSEVRSSFMKRWRRERTPRVLDEWLTDQLKDQPRWISMKRLQGVRLEQLKFESPLPPKSP